MRLLPLVSLAFAAAACASSPSSTSSASPTASASASSGPPARPLVANIVPTGATTSRLSGTVTLTPIDANTFSVAMEFRAAPNNRQLPWAFRPGACGDNTPNSDIGSRSAYGPIQTQADGQAHINTRLRIQLPPQQTLHVDVMQSNSQRDIILACGMLQTR